MQTALSDKELHSNLGSSIPLTPSFQPNAPPYPSADVKHAQSTAHDIPELDLREPVSTLLRLGTQRAHVKAEHSAGAAALVQGNLDLQEYIKWLAALWRVYDALELGLQVNSASPILAPTYDPALLARAGALAEDITYLLTLLPSQSTSVSAPNSLTEPATPLPPFPLPAFLLPVFNEPPKPLTAYIEHIRSLSFSSITAPGLLAHAYVRYLGDLSGGQVIGARIKKAYSISGSEGTKFYQFDFQKGGDAGGEESKVEAKKRLTEVKDWYRRGMDEAVGDDQKLKADLVEEANLAFEYNTDLFSIIQVTPKSGHEKTSETAQAVVGESKDVITQTLWFIVAAAVGVLLNIYVGPVVSGFLKSA